MLVVTLMQSPCLWLVFRVPLFEFEPQDFHTTTHIHIPYTGLPQIRHITILPTDLHHIERIHTISKDLNNITIPLTGIHYIGIF
jgi:hypothetical protein